MLCLFLVNETSFGQHLVVTISLEKEEFYRNEPVVLHVEVENENSREYEVNGAVLASPKAFRLKIMNQEGQELKYWGSQGGVSKRQLLPQGTFDHFYDIGAWFGEGDQVIPLLAFLNDGIYTVQAEYKPVDNEQMFLSNKFSFAVVEPYGEEVSVSSVWLEALRLDGREEERRIDLLRTIVDQHASSAFRPAAALRLFHIYMKADDTTNARVLLQKLLDEYPERFAAWLAALTFSSKMTVRSKLEFFQKLINDQPSPFIKEMSLRLTKQLERG